MLEVLRWILADGQFEPICGELADLGILQLNTTSCDEHVTEVE